MRTLKKVTAILISWFCSSSKPFEYLLEVIVSHIILRYIIMILREAFEVNIEAITLHVPAPVVTRGKNTLHGLPKHLYR